MNNVAYTITTHARRRIKERLGIESLEVASAWVADQLSKAKRSYKDEHKTNIVTDDYEIVLDGVCVITVKPKSVGADYTAKLSEILEKEITRTMTTAKRNLRKTEIEVAQHTLNGLKALNPKTKELIHSKLMAALEDKVKAEREVFAVEKAAEKYGITL